MASIQTKLELEQILELMEIQYANLFPTNGAGQVSAADIRTFMQTQIDFLKIALDSTDLQKPLPIEHHDLIIGLVAADIDANISHYHLPIGPQTINLPPLDPTMDQVTMQGAVLNGNSVTFVAAGGDVIQGDPIMDQLGVYSIKVVDGNTWRIQFSPLIANFIDLKDVPSEYLGNGGNLLRVTNAEDGVEFIPQKHLLQTSFAKQGNLAAGAYMRFGELITDDTSTGYITPLSGNIVASSIGRSDTDLSDIEVLVNGSVVLTLNTSAIATTELHTEAVSAGDLISARNKVGGNTMSDVSLSLVIAS